MTDIGISDSVEQYSCDRAGIKAIPSRYLK